MKHFLYILLLLQSLSVLGLAEPTSSINTDKTASLDLPDREVSTALREIADVFELNVVIPDSLHGRTSVKLRDVSWRQAYQVILAPIGYTFYEHGDIIKVVAKDPATVQQPRMLLEDSLGPIWIAVPVVVFVMVTAVCHIALFIGVLLDSHVEVRFAPRFVWALMVLFGGVIPLVGYWLIHHSNLRSQKQNAG